MKTQTIFLLTSCLLSGITMKSFSQVALDDKSANHAFVTSIAAIDNAAAFKTYASNIKVQRTFINLFGNNAENNWSMVGKDFLNRFHLNGLLTNMLFNKNGQLVYTITYGTEKDLREDVRKIVKSEYYDYSITMAIEVKENNRDIWVVKLDNVAEQKTVRIEDGEMELVQQFQKANSLK